jgi:solute carrier family 25 phosphate transporter 23/24/25/41
VTQEDIFDFWQRAVSLHLQSEFSVPSGTKETGNPLKYLLAGGTAGVVSRTATAPMDRLKIIMQTTTTPLKLLEATKKIWLEEGIAGFWRGNGANVLKTFPDHGLSYFSYEVYKKVLLQLLMFLTNL